MIARIDAFSARSARAMQAPEVRILDEEKWNVRIVPWEKTEARSPGNDRTMSASP